MQREVFFGQQLDLVASPDVERMYDLKTASYTVRGPARLGALIGDASEASLDALTRWARPIGIAFQLRDELLGTFGDPHATGKPAGNDLKAGKRTTLVVLAEKTLDDATRAPLDAVLGRADASDENLSRAIELLVSTGLRRRVEERAEALVAESNEALSGAPFDTREIATIGALLVDRSY
jgi:geranylgeranyl diphosphate synthase type I